MAFVRVALAGGLFLALASLLSAGEPQSYVTAFWPIPFVLLAVFLVAARLLQKPLEAVKAAVLAIPDWRFLLYMILLALFGTISAALLVHERLPHVTDEMAYLFQAKAFSEGTLGLSARFPEFFRPHFFYQATNGQELLYSLFQPGWPAVLTLGIWLGAPWLVNPLLAALWLVPIFLLARREFGQGVARLSLLVLVVSPFYLFMGASFMSHPLAALLTTWALERALALRREGRVGVAATLGLLVGALALVRIYNALLLAGLIALYFGVLAWRAGSFRRAMARPALRLAASAVLPFALGIGLQAAYNQATAGSPFVFGQDRYFAQTEAVPDCHRLGFGPGIGCTYEHTYDAQFKSGEYGLEEAARVTGLRLRSLTLNLHGVPWLMLAALLPLFVRGTRRRDATGLLYGLFLSLLLGYALFYYHGNCYGPRFFFEALGGLVILIALGLALLDQGAQAIGTNDPFLGRLLRAGVAALLACSVAFSLAILLPKLADAYTRYRGFASYLRRAVEMADISRGVVLIPGDDVDYGQAADFIALPNEKTDGLIFARQQNNQFVRLMVDRPDLPFYRFEPKRNILIALKPYASNGVSVFELETRWPLVEERGGHAVNAGFARFLPKTPENKDARGLYFKATEPDAHFRFDVEVPAEGDYQLQIYAMRGGVCGDWQLSYQGRVVLPPFVGIPDKKGAPYDFGLWQSAGLLHFPKGRASFEVRLTRFSPYYSQSGIGLDWLILRKSPEGLDQAPKAPEDAGWAAAGHVLPFRGLSDAPDFRYR